MPTLNERSRHGQQTIGSMMHVVDGRFAVDASAPASVSTSPAASGAPQLWQWWANYLQAISPQWPGTDLSFQQPILPDWTLAGVVINETNSSDPAMERAIVSRQSYGKQLGRTIDALAAFINETKLVDKTQPPFEEFFALKKEIDDVKVDTADTRFEQTLTDLKLLKKTDEEKFKQCLRRVADL